MRDPGSVASRFLFSLALLLALAACSPPIEPVVVPPGSGRNVPVVFIPGVTGTELRDSTTGRLVWGDTRSLFLPRDDGHALALPIEPAVPDVIEPANPILEIRLATYRRDIYRPLVRFMQGRGYWLGDLAAPAPNRDFYFFAYDWRIDSVTNARLLGQALERLRGVRGEKVLEVHLVAQSGGAHIARYFIKYGGASLDEAEAGRAEFPESIRVSKLVLVGTSNGGALRILREMDRGRRYILLGRTFRPEVFFTFPSLYQDLPVSSAELFVDREGDPTAIDLFDAGSWTKYGWSIFNDEALQRIARSRVIERFGTPSSRIEFLERQLRNAKRFHVLLGRDVPRFVTRYTSLQSALEPTPSSAMVSRVDGKWRTFFLGDREVDGDPWLRFMTVSQGDRHATLESQGWLSRQEKAALARAPLYFEGGHFEIVRNSALHRKLLEALRE